MRITTIGLDLAKNIFQVHGVTDEGDVAFNKPLRRARVLPFFAKLEPCLIGIEACSSAHYWGRELTALGHQVKLMPPSYVKPYVKRGKSDAADAEAICEAVTRPTMRFVQVKSAEQQALLCQHRAREVMVGQRTQLSNTTRGLLGEFNASASVATIGRAHQFKSERDLAAWIGLTPLNKSSGGKERLGKISRMGDRYLRQLLVVGMSSRVRTARSHLERVDPWTLSILDRKPTNSPISGMEPCSRKPSRPVAKPRK